MTKNLKQPKKITSHPLLFKLRSVMRHVARVRKRNTQKIFVKKPGKNGSLGISLGQWEDNIKMYFIN